MAEQTSTNDELYSVLKPIGAGGYGTVYLVRHPTLGDVILKKLRNSNDIGENDLKYLRREADILKNLRHQNIVTFYDGQFDSKLCGLFLEFVEYGPVDGFLKQFTVDKEWKMQIIHDIASAMTYLHANEPPVIHGDLKCLNILIGNDFHAKICDFGLARIHYTMSKSITAPAVCGTIEYIAPEYLSDPRKIKTKEFDVYSYAISVWEIFSEKSAYYDFSDRKIISFYVVEKKSRPLMTDIADTINDSVMNMIEKCWHQDGGTRPSFATVRDLLQAENARIRKEIKDSLRRLVKQQLKQQRSSTTSQGGEMRQQLCSSWSENNSTKQETKQKQNQDGEARLLINHEDGTILIIQNERVEFDLRRTNGNDVEYESVETSDQHHPSRSYKVLRNPGISSVKFKFNIPNNVYICNVSVQLIQCSGPVNFFVNEKIFKSKYFSSPSNCFGSHQFLIPSTFLKEGANWFNIVLDKDSEGVYWLSDFAIDCIYIHLGEEKRERITTISTVDTFDFSREVSGVKFQQVFIADCYRKNRPYRLLTIPHCSSVTILFSIDDDNSICWLNVILNHCRTTSHGIVNICVNDVSLYMNYFPEPRDNFGDEKFIIPRKLLRVGENTLAIQLSPYSPGVYWLSHAIIEAVRVKRLDVVTQESTA